MTATPPEPVSPLATTFESAGSAAPKPLPRVGALFIGVYALAMFGIWMAINLPATVTVALRIAEIDPANKTTTYSLVAGIGTLVAVLANPFFGRLSDRTRSRFGRRRPWIVMGLAGTTVGAAVIGLSDSVPMLILGWVLMQAFINAAIAATLAIVADRIPESQHGLVGALSGTASAASVVVGIFFIQAFPTSILAQVGLPVAIAIVFGLALVALMKDDKPAAGERAPFTLKEFAGSFYINPRKSPDFAWFLLAFFLINLGLGVMSTYAVYYLQDQIKITEDDLPGNLFVTFLLSGLVALVVAPLAGWISDKTGRRKPLFVLAAVLMATGMGVIVLAQDATMFIIGQTLGAGLAAGILFGIYIAFAVATLKDTSTVGRDLGIVNIAFTLPFSLVPFAAPLLLGSGDGPNYSLLYIVGGVLSLTCIPVLLKIRATR
jgi:MFS family permease